MSYLTQAVTSTSLYTYMVPHFWNNASFFFNFFEKSGKFTPTVYSSVTYFEAKYNRNSSKSNKFSNFKKDSLTLPKYLKRWKWFTIFKNWFLLKFSIIPLFQSVYLTIHQHSPGYIFTEKPPPKNLYHEKDQWELLEISEKNDQTHTQYLSIYLQNQKYTLFVCHPLNHILKV